jgi:hypothetical protein
MAAFTLLVLKIYNPDGFQYPEFTSLVAATIALDMPNAFSIHADIHKTLRYLRTVWL